MPSYRIFYLKERQIHAYRQAAPRPQPYRLRPSDYEEGPEVEAASPYAAWKLLEEGTEKYPGARKLVVGDVLQTGGYQIVVMNFWGFDDAAWQEAEPAGHPPMGATAEDPGARSENGAEVEPSGSRK